MLMSVRTRAGAAAAAVVTLGLIPGGITAPAVGGTVAARAAALPTLNIVTKVDGFTMDKNTVQAGRIKMVVTGIKKGGSAGVIKLKTGYTWKRLNKDLGAAFSGGPDAIAGIKSFNRHVVLYGGVGASGGRTRAGTVVIPKAGTYHVFHFTNQGVAHKKLNVTGPFQARPEPHVDGTVKAMTGARWGGAKVLPHKGTLRFKNEATDSPHFLVLQHVAKGTTRGEVVHCFNDPECTFGFGREGGMSSEVLSPGKSMTADYDLPRGTYVEMCFYTDAMTGLPHAFMGMVRVITLK